MKRKDLETESYESSQARECKHLSASNWTTNRIRDPLFLLHEPVHNTCFINLMKKCCDFTPSDRNANVDNKEQKHVVSLEAYPHVQTTLL